MTFNPRLSAEADWSSPVARNGRLYVESPESYLRGDWNDLHPLNTPGPFYGGMTDTCCDGPQIAPRSLLYDHAGQGFVWRQPRTEDETHALMSGASSDPLSGYGWDGDNHWTPELVRAWWKGQPEHQQAIDLLVKHVAGPRPELVTEWADLMFRCTPVGGYAPEERALFTSLLADYLTYRQTAMRPDLQRYIYFLENGDYPDTGARLPNM